MRVVYIAGPYSGKTTEETAGHVAAAEEMAKKLLLAGYAPLIPHRINATWQGHEHFKDFTTHDWLERLCFPLMKKCDAMVMLAGWECSIGAVIERQNAIELGIPVFYSMDDFTSAFPSKKLL